MINSIHTCTLQCSLQSFRASHPNDILLGSSLQSFLLIVHISASLFLPFVLQYYPDSNSRGKREGSGSTEATEMILNNLFYITTKVRLCE